MPKSPSITAPKTAFSVPYLGAAGSISFSIVRILHERSETNRAKEKHQIGRFIQNAKPLPLDGELVMGKLFPDCSRRRNSRPD